MRYNALCPERFWRTPTSASPRSAQTEALFRRGEEHIGRYGHQWLSLLLSLLLLSLRQVTKLTINDSQSIVVPDRSNLLFCIFFLYVSFLGGRFLYPVFGCPAVLFDWTVSKLGMTNRVGGGGKASLSEGRRRLYLPAAQHPPVTTAHDLSNFI